MPEGHTIHRLARDQNKDLAGTSVRASSPQGRFDDGAALVNGRVLERAEAAGKHLVHHWDDGSLLYVHLGLIGKFRRIKAEKAPQGAVRLRLEGGEHAWELVGPMRCELISPDEWDAITSKLGPDPLVESADPDQFASNLSRRKIPITAALLDQAVIAGIGNVYRAELLFLCGIHPRRPAKDLSDAEVEMLWAETVTQLKVGLRLNRIVTRSREELGVPLSKATADNRLYAYKRHGQACHRCSDEIVSDKIGARLTWWCATCQPS